MILRSMLFAPGKVARRVEKALQLNADAVILDLEDSVPIAEKPVARAVTAKALAQSRRSVCFVRINALGTGMTIDDMEGVVSAGLNGIMLNKVEEPSDLEKVEKMRRAYPDYDQWEGA